MGRFLDCGLANKIVIKNTTTHKSNDEVLERIGKNLDLNLYNRADEENYIFLYIKKDIFEKHAVEFIIEQSKFFHKYDKKSADEELPTLKGLKYDELIEASKRHEVKAFQFLKGNIVCNDISYLDPEDECEIYCDLISFVGDGKVFFECYFGIFTYLRNCMINASKNPIRGAAVITIIG